MAVSTVDAASSGSGPGGQVRLAKSSPRHGERVIEGLLAAAAGLSVLVTAGIVLALVVPLFTFFAHVNPIEFLTGTTWTWLSAHLGGYLRPHRGSWLITCSESCSSSVVSAWSRRALSNQGW